MCLTMIMSRNLHKNSHRRNIHTSLFRKEKILLLSLLVRSHIRSFMCCVDVPSNLEELFRHIFSAQCYPKKIVYSFISCSMWLKFEHFKIIIVIFFPTDWWRSSCQIPLKLNYISDLFNSLLMWNLLWITTIIIILLIILYFDRCFCGTNFVWWISH